MNYIAYTIGPIYDTIFDTLNGKNKTKKLYAGSYYFSYFMKLLLKNIKEDFDVIVPYVDGNILENNYNMGLFHDRFIATCKELSKDAARNIFNKKVDETFESLAIEIKDKSISKDLKDNMDNHLVVLNDDELKTINENIIFAINQVLDSKELNRCFSFNKEKNYIQAYQDKFVQSSNKSVKTLEKLSGDMKYYAVITADGDKMGEKIKNEATQDPQKIKEISQKLFEFFTNEKDVFEITDKEFGGELIYAGGDDILAFVPVKYESKTFLDYIEVLDKRFQEKVGDDVSLSFGVNVAYVKYPLRDAIKKAFELLHSAKSNAKNSISIKLTKHSGQYFGTTIDLSSSKYLEYKKLLDDILKDKVSLPHSLHHSLKRYEQAIIEIYNNNNSIKPLFETIFNDVRKDEEKQGLEDIQKYLDAYKPSSSNEFDDVFSALSLIKFLREDRK